MGCSMRGARMLHSGLSTIMDTETSTSCFCVVLPISATRKLSSEAMFNRWIGFKSPSFPRKMFWPGILLGYFSHRNLDLLNCIKPSVCPSWNRFVIRHGWRVAFALNTDGTSGNGEQDSLNSASPSGIGSTRLGRLVSAGGRQLLVKLNSARKNFPMKIFLLLLGFYTANALATILGQTGDWDVLVAGVVVAAIEGIGMLMYKKPPSLLMRRLESFVVMMNYWKAGVCLGLFVDAFKLGS